MSRILRKSLATLSFSRSNRLGSDEKIAALYSRSLERLQSEDSLEELRRQLADKERQISQLQRQIKMISPKGMRSSESTLHRPSRSLMTARSASIISSIPSLKLCVAHPYSFSI